MNSKSRPRERCRHSTCGCSAIGDATPYCSAYCANVVEAAGDEMEAADAVGACSCSHRNCTRDLREANHGEAANDRREAAEVQGAGRDGWRSGRVTMM
jgi:hypothetical protein